MIDRETVQRINDAADIVEVVGEYVNLTRRGANYMGLCPFHNERTPSFSVNRKRNFCYCFSCHKGGSPVNFIMEKEGISYHDALLWLAKKYNITVHEKELTDEERAKITERESMIVASEWAMRYFHDNLYNTEEGRAIGLSYFYERGLSDESIKRYMLGYSLDSGHALLDKARSEGFDLEVLKKIGLTGTSQEGRNYDKFRGRVMFPIRNSSGKPVAFGGRTLKGEAAKYINSPETLLYKKSNELYGIFEAKNDIVKSDRIYLMEGYLDVISSWQEGLRNVVASSGTALTDGQIALLHRFTENVTLVYDGDPAGIKASLRGIDMLLSHKMHVNVLLLPDGDDPDSFAKKHGSKDFNDFFESNQTDFIEFKAKVLMKDASGNPQEHSRAVLSIVESIACIPNDIERSLYIQKSSSLLNVKEDVLARAVSVRRKEIVKKFTEDKYGRKATLGLHEENKGQLSEESQHDDTSQKKESEDLFTRKEEVLIKYAIRYGFSHIAVEIDSDEEDQSENTADNEQEYLSVVEFIDDELKADNLKFQHPVFAKTFDFLLRSFPSFWNEREKLKKEKELRIELEKKAFYDSMIESGMSVAEIQKAEIRHDEDSRRKISDELRTFSINYSGNLLLNHEDDDIRQLVNHLLEETHKLSAIYFKDGKKIEKEEDKLSELVPRALSELRGEILNFRIRELKTELEKLKQENNVEAQAGVIQRLQKLYSVRGKIAENLGERILSPKI